MPYLVHNERTKLIANALDRASTGAFLAGVAVPTATAMFGQQSIAWEYFFSCVLLWVAVGVILHVEARKVLGALRE
jgi:Na+/melibiose symporter-like transporter